MTVTGVKEASQAHQPGYKPQSKAAIFAVCLVLFICIAPSMLNLLGYDFGVGTSEVGTTYFTNSQELLRAVRGPLLATIIEMICISTAVITVVFSFIHFFTRRDFVSPVIGIALGCSSMLAAYHVLTLNGLIDMPLEGETYVRLTWLFSRIFHASIIFIISLLVLNRAPYLEKAGMTGIYRVGLVFLLMTMAVLVLLYNMRSYNTITYDHLVLRRPYDVIPLFLFVVNAVLVMPVFYKRYPSLFSFALMLSMIPSIVTHLHEIESSSMFDNHYMIARFLNAFSFLIPAAGLAFNYLVLNKVEQNLIKDLEDESERRREAQDTLRSTLDSTIEGIIAAKAIRDKKGEITDFEFTIVNEAAARLLSRSSEDHIGRRLLDLYPGNLESGLFDAYKEVTETGISKTLEFHYAHEHFNTWFYHSIGKCGDGWVLSFSDVSARREMQDRLIEREHFIQRLAQSTPSMIYLYDVQSRTNVYINHMVDQLLGYTPDEVAAMGSNWFESIMLGEDHVNHENYYQRLIDSEPGEVFTNELKLRHKNGTYRWVIIHETVFQRDAEGLPQLVLGSAIDNTERKVFEENLLESKLKFEALFNEAFQLMALMDTEGRILEINRPALTFLQQSLNEVQGVRFSELKIFQNESYALKQMEIGFKVAQKNQGSRFTTPINSFAEVPVVLDINLKPIVNSQGQVSLVLIEARDITALKQANERLVRTETLLNEALNAAQMGTWEIDAGTGTTFWSPQMYHMFGYEEGQVDPNDPRIFAEQVHPEDQANVLEALTKSYEAADMLYMDYRIITTSGEVRYHQARGRTIKNGPDDKGRIIGLQLDVTEQMLASQRVKESEALYRGLAKNIPKSCVFLFDQDLNVLLAEGEELANLVPEGQDIYARPLFELLPIESNRDEVTARLRASLEGQEQILERRVKEEYYRVHIFPVRLSADAQAVTDQGLVMINNITDLKNNQIELEAKVKDLDRSNKELEQFAYVASHDLQEPLRKIRMLGDRLKLKFTGKMGDEGEDYINRMQNAASRMNQLISDLLNFSRVSKVQSEPEVVNLNQVLRNIQQDLEEAIMSSEAQMEVGPLPVLWGDGRQLGQLFLNLLSNALKFRKPGVVPVVKVFQQPVSGEFLNQHGLNKNTKWLQIVIKDNGIGFENKYTERIFTIFQRLHGRNEYQGTGIGLAICKKVVENHHGHITAESQPGEGATFYVTLPQQTVKNEVERI